MFSALALLGVFVEESVVAEEAFGFKDGLVGFSDRNSNEVEKL